MSPFSLPENEIPKEVWAAVRIAVDQQGPDVASQTEAALSLIRASSSFDNFADKLVRYAVNSMVYEVRHNISRATKNREHREQSQPKVDWTRSKKARAIIGSVYDEIYMGGTRFGDILVKDIDGIRSNLAAQRDGLSVNVELLGWAEQWARQHRVPPGESIRRAIPEANTRRAIARIKAKYKDAA